MYFYFTLESIKRKRNESSPSNSVHEWYQNYKIQKTPVFEFLYYIDENTIIKKPKKLENISDGVKELSKYFQTAVYLKNWKFHKYNQSKMYFQIVWLYAQVKKI